MAELIHQKERIYFAILLIFSMPTLFALCFSGIGLLILFLLVFIPLFIFLISMAMIRTNGVKVTKSQFPDIYATVEDVAGKMELKKLPDVYIVQSMGILNAFATRFFGRNMVVLYSEIAELLVLDGKRELDFVIAHELAHIKRNHILKNLLVLPGNWIPFLAEAYSRACEYTCDRMASHYISDLKASKYALTVLAVGKHLYHNVNEEEYLREASYEKGFFAWFSEKLSTHPILPKRIYALENQFGQGYDISFRVSGKLKVKIVSIITVLILIIIGSIFAVKLWLNSSLYSDFMLGRENTTPLMSAVTDDDKEKVLKLIQDGADVNAQDSYGWTALHYAIMWYGDEEYEDMDDVEESTIDPEMVKLLLDHGADPNSKSEDVDPVLLEIANEDQPELLDMLIEHGADINAQDSYGETALFNAAYNENVSMVQALLENGANPAIKNNDDQTVLDVAKENNYSDIVKILEKNKN